MSDYYFLVNKTKKEKLHLDYHLKISPIRYNEAVHFAFINYMTDNLGDDFQIRADWSDMTGYAEIDLLGYKFVHDDAIQQIVEKLNEVYGEKKYEVVGGRGVRK